MYNLYNHIAQNPTRCHQLSCGETLLTLYTCGLKNKYEELWSHHNYIVYVVEGRKVWHTAEASYDLRAGSCVFVRKGANVVEQFFDAEFCFFLFFIPDDFICEVLRTKTTPISSRTGEHSAIMPIENSVRVQHFFHSMLPYFDAGTSPDASLLELKFRELILTIADNSRNGALLSWFRCLLCRPGGLSLQQVMEDNFCFNLQLEEFARLCARSLSAFKRDFMQIYKTSPGKWLMEKRLTHALHLLSQRGLTVGEAAFESGFENAAHFSRVFRRRFGMAPISLRQRMIA